MVWLTLGLTTLIGLTLVWIATQENRSARILGAVAVLVHTLMLIGGLGLEPTSTFVTIAGLIAVISQAAILGVITLWISTTESRLGRFVGGVILAALSVALTYGVVFGPMWKVNVLIVATIALTWVFGRRKRTLAHG